MCDCLCQHLHVVRRTFQVTGVLNDLETTYPNPPHLPPELHLMNMNELTPAVISIVLRVRSLAANRCSAFPHFISLTYPHAPRFGPPVPPSRGAEINFVSHLHIKKRRALATRTQTDTYALLRLVPSRRRLQSVSVLHCLDTCRFPFHTPRMPSDANCEPGARVSWHADERSCLMSQLSEDRPGTSARESEIQPLR